MKQVVGILHPGMMGVTVARAAAAGGSDVVWASDGRSVDTMERAVAAGLHDAGSIEALAHAADVVVSVVPPSGALHVAEQVGGTGFSGTFVDANAVSPAKVRRISDAVAGAVFVDGSIVGPPADEPGTTRLYLSGEHAGHVAEVFAGTNLDPLVAGDEAGMASALKMAYAAYTKGSAALLMAIRALADHHGLGDLLDAEWDLSIPGLGDRSERTLAAAPRKAWRFSGEMIEIAATFAEADLPSGFHEAAADIFRRIGPQADGADPSDVVLRILGQAPG